MLSVTTTAILCFIFGSIVGSFLGVCVYRIPMARYEPAREGIRELAAPVTIWRPARSFCPHCERQLAWWHNIPLLSFCILRGKCAFCGTRIPLRYLLIEVLAGTLATACYLSFGLTLTGALAFLLSSALLVIVYIDIDYMIIPDLITYPGTALGLLVAAANQYLSPPGQLIFWPPFSTSLYESGLGLLFGPGVLLLVWGAYYLVRRREGLGLGDIKLLALLGALCGPECAWFTIFAGSVFGAVFGLVAIAFRKRSFTTYIPFGPYLAIAALLYLFKANQLALFLINGEGVAPWRMLR